MTRTQLIATPEWQQPVIAMPLTQAFPQFDQVKEFRSKVCLFNHDRTKVFDVVSNRYQVIPHITAFTQINEGLEEFFGKPVKSDVRSINGGARMSAKFRLPIKPIQIAKGDVSEITLMLRNSYDRGWTFSATLGAFRLVCSNGMMIGESFGKISARHLQSVEPDPEQIPLLEQLSDMIARAPELKALWEEWADVRMTFETAQALLAGQFPARYLDPVLQESHFPRTKWQLYNDLTRFSTHDTKSLNRRLEFDEKISRLFYNGAVIEGEQADSAD